MYQKDQRAMSDLSNLVSSIQSIFRCTSYESRSEIVIDIATTGNSRSRAEYHLKCCKEGLDRYSDMEPSFRDQLSGWLESLTESDIPLTENGLANTVMNSCRFSPRIESVPELVP